MNIIFTYNKNKSVTNEPRPGRPKLSSKREDRSLVLKSIRHQKLTAPLLKIYGRRKIISWLPQVQ